MTTYSETPRTRWEILALAGILLIALFLRLHDLDKSYWLDEFFTLRDARPSYGEILSNRHNPLVFVLAKFTIENMGETESLLRLPSVIASLIALLFAYAIGRRAAGPLGGLFAAFVLGTSPYFLRFSQEARYYAFIVCAGLAAIYYAHQCLRSPRDVLGWIGLGVALLVGSLTHAFFVPFAGGIVLSTMIAAAIWGEGSWKKKLLLAMCVAGISAAIIGGEALFYKDESFVYRFGHKIVTKVGGVIGLGGDAEPEGAAEFAQIPEGYSGQLYRLTPGLMMQFLGDYFPFGISMCLLLIVLGGIGAWQLFRTDRQLGVVLIGSIVVSPIPVMFLTSYHAIFSRYLVLEWAFLNVLIAIGAGQSCRFFMLRARNAIRQAAVEADAAAIESSEHDVGDGEEGPKAETESEAVEGTVVVGNEPLAMEIARRWAPTLIGAVVVMVFLGGWSVRNWSDLQNYYDWKPRREFPHFPMRDWRGAAELVAADIRDGDVVLYSTVHSTGLDVRPTDRLINQQLRGPVEHYLKKIVPPSLHGTLKHEGVFTAQELAAALRRHADRRVVFVARYATRIDKGLRDLATENADRHVWLGEVEAWVWERPYDNLLTNADFTLDLAQVEARGGVSIDSELSSEMNTPVLRIQSDGGKTVYWNTLLKRGRGVPITNASFERWHEDLPIGWEPETEPAEADGALPIGMGGTSGRGAISLEIASSTDRIAFSQKIEMPEFEATRIQLSAFARADRTDDVGIALVWACCGETKRAEATHSGSGQWERITLEVDEMPSHLAAPRIEVFRNGGDSAARIDDVELSLIGGPLLEADTHYTLSFRARYVGVEGDIDWGAFRVASNAYDEAGSQDWDSLIELRGTSDGWRDVVVNIERGGRLPANLSELSFHIGLFKAKGEVWIADLALSKGYRTNVVTARAGTTHDVRVAEARK